MNHLECNCGAEFWTIHELLKHREVHPPRTTRIIEWEVGKGDSVIL